MRAAVTLCLLAIGGCGSPTSDAPQTSLAGAPVGSARAPVTPFTPPTPPGCAGASAYDACFAIADATPLEVRARLPRALPPDTVAFVRFHRASGTPEPLDLDRMKFKVRGGGELLLYFQVRPGAYLVEVGVDSDGDGDPEGPADDLGWSAASPEVAVADEADAAIVDVGATPIATAFTLAARH